MTGESRSGESRKQAARVLAAVVLAALAIALFVGLDSGVIDRISEERCVVVVRGMIASGDWLVPRLGEAVRLHKPPLFYWVGAATATLLGDTGPIAVRLPSALAALALVALTMRWGTTLGGLGTGARAGAVLAATVQLTISGRRGDAEMLLALLCAAALFTFDRIHTTRQRLLLPLFGVLAGLAFLTKATAVLLVVTLPILVFLALERELRPLRDRAVLGSLALALAIGLSWYVAILALVPGAFENLWLDLTRPLGNAQSGAGASMHFRPVWWYLHILPSRAAPASLLLPLVAWRLVSTRLYRGEPRLRFAALTFLVPLLAFSLLPQKQKHYTLVMLPGLALVSAEAACAFSLRGQAWLARSVGTPLALAGIAAVLLLTLFAAWIDASVSVTFAAGLVALGGLFTLALASALRGEMERFACSWLPGFLLALALLKGAVNVEVARLRATGPGGPSPEERRRLDQVASEHPWIVEIFRLSNPSPREAEPE